MGKEDLYISVPSYFRCPISLDVMKSPVSLCTGITYDRTSIQRWLDSGHNTCPATMQILNNKDLVPNHNLHRLIQLWSSSLLDEISNSSPTDPDKLLELLWLAAESAENRSVFLRCETLESLTRVMRSGVSAAGLVETVARAEPEFKVAVLESEEFLRELVRGLNKEEEGEEDALLSCILCLSNTKRGKQRLVSAGLIPELGRLLRGRKTGPLKLLEAMLGCSEGRKAMCDGDCVSAVVGKLVMKGKGVSESAVVVIWSLCYWLRDQKAREAVAAANGLTKILLVMQSGCSPEVKRMCADLLRIFRVNAKSCLGSYDTKTIHIMPF